MLHLHRLEDDDLAAGGDLFAFGRHLDHGAGQLRAQCFLAGIELDRRRTDVVLVGQRGDGQLGQLLVEEVRGHPAGPDLAVGQQLSQQLDVRANALDAEFTQGGASLAHRGLHRRSVHVGDDLGQQRVVSRADDQARPAVGVDAYAGPARRREHRQGARRRQHRPIGGEGLRVDPGLNRNAAPRRRLADDFVSVRSDSGRKPQLVIRRAAGDGQLDGHQVHAGRFLGDRVLHLDPGVDLEEHQPVAGHQEFDGGHPA